MIKLTLEKAAKQKTIPYFKIYFWNIPERGMKTYSEQIIKTSDLELIKRYVIEFYILQEKIKNKKFFASDLRVVETIRNSIEKPLSKYFYDINDTLSIQLALENKNQDLPDISNIDLEYVKYFDEYGEEYNVKIQLLSEILKDF
jgi:hypothetical protein